MKKTILALSGIALMACNTEEPTNGVIVSGNVTHTEAPYLLVYDLSRSLADSPADTIALQDDGSFSDTLKMSGKKVNLIAGRKRIPLYFSDGANLDITVDMNDFEKTLRITGKGAAINNYLQQKSEIQKEIIGDTNHYMLSEDEFLKRITAVKEAQKEKLNAIVELDSDFKKKEEKNLAYEYLGEIQKYPQYHPYYTKKDEFEVSEGFLRGLDTLDMEDQSAFEFSPAYKSLLESSYRDLAIKKTAKDSTIAQDIAFLEEVSANRNEKIKNALLYDAARIYMSFSGDPERYYQTYDKYATDETYKKHVRADHEALLRVSEGRPSPKFVAYENHAGGTTSLDDLKGKYVYIDVWATWCGPCLREIPSLKELEADYHDKPIQFVSVSIDTEDAYEKWKTMVKERELGGIQLLADNAWESEWVEDYLIKGIPRFILIDPQGNIVNYNAPRPSSEEIRKVFEELDI
ncbi:TlpA family protein disulfide reductase [Robertkochia aurantiaca]|uniref:TlpA family protein disulfide reductase n=1 Tax=Robertkochia aurantiaca TaxID=2873700 RepID=UPI001CCEB1E7|nr:TlpA disulfide reductase family protein [Robertkochia sp. 3YJGBD-33]